ncbi:MAG: EAL domain-containing protein [Vallitaleaceae bacterium]|nr:EAL domain-containing protein [Vallitaleaceae bacterium]
MLVQFQYLIIAAIAMSISIYIVFLSSILDHPELAGLTVDKILSTSLWFIIVTASIVTKGMFFNSFIDRNTSPKYQFTVSLLILSAIIIAALIIANKKSVYFYKDRYRFLMGSIILIIVIPVNSFSIYYYGSTLFLVLAVINFVRKCYYRLHMHNNLGLYFLVIASSGVLVGVIFSSFFNTLLFNTFVLGILSLVILGFFVFYILFFHEHLIHKITKLNEQKQIIKEKNVQLIDLLYKDDITPLPNRLAFEKRILDKNVPVYLGLLNVSDFMSYNKLLGFDRGNLILKELSEQLELFTSEKVSFYRYYSDKFIILFEDMKYKEVIELTQRMVTTIHKKRINGVIIRTYVGLYYFDISRNNKNDFINVYGALETASSMSKSNKQNLYFYQSLDHEKEKNKTSFELKILDSIEKELFEVYYQPQYNPDKSVNSFEALLRLRYDGENIPVMDIISIAERKGLMPAITKQVVNIVFHDISQYSIFKNKKVSINISPDLLVDDEFKDYLLTMYTNHHLEKGQIVIEVTETSLFNDVEKVNSTISYLKKIGFEISIDDFGTGYSSIFRFSEHDIDEVKFDKIFIQDIENPKTYRIMQKTIELFKSFDVRVVIEGVEEEQQLEAIQNFDIDLYQGYLFCRPQPIQDLLLTLSHETSPSPRHIRV